MSVKNKFIQEFLMFLPAFYRQQCNDNGDRGISSYGSKPPGDWVHKDIYVGFEVDPKLINPGGGGTIGDPHLLATLDAYQLQESSPLINAGFDLRATFGIEPGKYDFYRKTLPRGVKLNIGAAE